MPARIIDITSTLGKVQNKAACILICEEAIVMGRTGGGGQIELDLISARTMQPHPVDECSHLPAPYFQSRFGISGFRDSPRFDSREMIYDEPHRSIVTVAQTY